MICPPLQWFTLKQERQRQVEGFIVPWGTEDCLAIVKVIILTVCYYWRPSFFNSLTPGRCGSNYKSVIHEQIPDSKVDGANMGPTWGRQDPGGPHVGHVNLAIWDVID